MLFLLGSVKGMLCLCMEYVGVILKHLYYIETLPLALNLALKQGSATATGGSLSASKGSVS